MGYSGHGWGMGFGIWFTLIVFGIFIFYFLKESKKSEKDHSSAQDILDKRYANGEIDTQEYQEKTNILKKI
jgi:putative membrane protein